MKHPQLWHYESYGDEESPTILFLHGFLGTGGDWCDVVRRLQGDFRCIAVDLPGHGGTALAGKTDKLSMDSVVGELYALVEQTCRERPALVGYSLGGRIAMHAVQRNPAVFSSVTVESASPGIESELLRQARAAVDDERAKQLVQGGIERFLSDWYHQPLFASLHRRPELLNEVVKARGNGTVESVATVLRQLSPGRVLPLWEELCSWKLPTLLVSGAYDHKYGAVMRRMSKLIPHADWRIIAEAGHNTHREQPEAFAETLHRFLSVRREENSVGGQR